jgi:ubiquinone/menaquinone biosynthesis C-methylase UbiE
MVSVQSIKQYFLKGSYRSNTNAMFTDAELAYNIWSSTYDDQPDNLMLLLDEEIFRKLIENVVMYNKNIADIGCGTGRHWGKILQKKPAQLSGYDISEGMLNKLKAKFPNASVHRIQEDTIDYLPQSSIDLIISTLTIAHIENAENTLHTWFNALKPNADLIITDFHPDALANNGKRTFKNGNKQITIKNFVHPLPLIKRIAQSHDFVIIKEEVITINEQHRYFYEKKEAIHVYEKFKGNPIIYGLHLKRENVN